MGVNNMKLSANEAKELIPRSYIPSDQLYLKIKSAAETGLQAFYSDLTLSQIDELKELGYKVERNEWSRNYKIEWR